MLDSSINLVKMKFSYRVITVILLVCSLIMLYFYWNEDWMDWYEYQKTAGRKTSLDPAQFRSGPMKSSAAPNIFNPEECSFAQSKGGEADICTYDILHQIVDQPKNEENTPRHLGQASRKYENMEYKPKPGSEKLPLKIILVPHSHNDPGWHKTVQGYFQDQTEPTLNNMVEKLAKFPNMTFVWAESVFLHMWYQELSPQKQAQVKRLIQKGQLEIVVGSWVVPDEANPHFTAMVDQMIEGHQWLEKTMGVKPQNTWTLDPFGYSSTLPYLYKRAGFENMIVLRVHEKLKESLQETKALEFFWRQHWDDEHTTDIFTQMMPYKLYNIKHTCGPDHSICLQFDFRRIPGEWSEARAEPITDHNVDRQAKLLLGQYQKKANLYRHNVVLVPLGDDFRYDRNIEWDQQYKNYMTLFNYINRKKEWNVQASFGTLKDYFNAVKDRVANNAELEKAGFPSLQGDFFPYTDENNEYWTGYFTTRPFDKNFGRELEVHLRAAEILNSIALATSIQRGIPFKEYTKNMDNLPQARQDLGLFQHHDAITGTARSYVVMDYEQRLHTALEITENVIRNAAAYLVGAAKPGAKLSSPPLELDIDQAKSLKMLSPTKKVVEFSDKGLAEVVLFNSVAQEREELVKVTVPGDRIEVYCDKGDIVISQINPIFTSNTDISIKHFELAFFAKLPPLAMVRYRLKAVSGSTAAKENYAAYVRMYNAAGFIHPKNVRFNIMPPAGETITLENDVYRARFSSRSGMMHSITTKSKIITTQVNMEYLMYKSRGSGAYIFNPTGPAVDTEMSTRPVLRVIKGPVFSEIQMVQELVEGTVRLCNTTGFQGQAFMIDNIADLRSKENKELIMRLSTDIKHNGTFYTDLNAFHIMKRKHFNNLAPEANYYPMSAFAYVEDAEKRLSLISAQPLGVSCQEEGSLEVMLERRLQYDDGRGLGEGVLDNKRAPSRFYLIIERKEMNQPEVHLSMPSMVSHRLANNLRNHVFTLLTPPTMLNASLPSFHPLSQPLPCDMELMNLRSIDIENSGNVPSAALLLNRVGYQCGFPMVGGFTCDFSHGEVNLEKLFSGAVQLKSVWETTISLMHNKTVVQEPSQTLRLKPMEIYAFKTTFT